MGLNIPARPPSGAHEGILAGVYASVLIPEEIGVIPFSDYKILRERSADVRVAFSKFVQECSHAGGLQRIESTTTLQRRIEDSGRELAREFEKFQTGGSKALRKVKRWWPFTMGGVLAIAQDVIPPQWTLIFGIAAQVTKFAPQAALLPPDGPKETVFNLTAKRGNDIRDLPRIPDLLAAR